MSDNIATVTHQELSADRKDSVDRTAQRSSWFHQFFSRSKESSAYDATEKDKLQSQSNVTTILGSTSSAPLPIHSTMTSDITPPSSFPYRRGSSHMFPSFGMLVSSPSQGSFDDQGSAKDEFDTSEMIHFLNQGAK